MSTGVLVGYEYLYSVQYMLSFTSAYLLGIWSLRKFYQHRAPSNPKTLMKLYNAGQIILNGYLMYGLYEIVGFPNIFGINISFSPNLEWYVFIHYLSKIYDFCDTIFIVMKKSDRQLSFLHVYHHVSVLPLWGLVIFSGQGNGTNAYGALVNSFIHFIMYGHYFITSFGINNPLKFIITKLQIVQFYSIIIHSICVMLFDNVVSRYFAPVLLTYCCTLIVMFNSFYKQTYVKN